MPDPFRWGLLSTARINRSLIPPMQASPRHRLVAVASRDAERARTYAEDRRIPKAYGTYEALLADPEIDAVYLPLPNHLHSQWTLKAIAAGKHVLCEKPLALTLPEVDAIEAAAAEAGVVVAEGFMYRHHPRTHRVKALIEEGAIGRLRQIRGAFTFFLNRPNDIRWDPDKGGGGLWDVGCYPLSFARYVTGAEPEVVYGQQVTGPSGVDVQFNASLRFPGEVLVQFDAGIQAQFRMEMEFVGTEGRIQVPMAFKPGAQAPLVIQRGDDRIEEMVEGDAMLYLGELDDLAAAAQTGAPPRISLSDSRANIAALEALLTSARKGQPVHMP